MMRRSLRSCLKVVKRLRVPDGDDDQQDGEGDQYGNLDNSDVKEGGDVPADHVGQGGAVVQMGQGRRTGHLEI